MEIFPTHEAASQRALTMINEFLDKLRNEVPELRQMAVLFDMVGDENNPSPPRVMTYQTTPPALVSNQGMLRHAISLEEEMSRRFREGLRQAEHYEQMMGEVQRRERQLAEAKANQQAELEAASRAKFQANFGPEADATEKEDPAASRKLAEDQGLISPEEKPVDKRRAKVLESYRRSDPRGCDASVFEGSESNEERQGGEAGGHQDPPGPAAPLLDPEGVGRHTSDRRIGDELAEQRRVGRAALQKDELGTGTGFRRFLEGH